MSRHTIKNWFGGIESEPAVVVDARCEHEIAQILRDPVTYPSPVRAVGSNHSTTECGVAEVVRRGERAGGTLVRMRGMDRILEITEDTITAEAGVLLVDAAEALRERGLQFYVNVELGNLTMGSAATGGTKDASFPGEMGQVSSYCTGVRMVLASGEVVDITEGDAEKMRAVRASHGLFGVVVRATFRVKRIRPMKVDHRSYDLESFTTHVPTCEERRSSIMLYINPYIEKVLVEERRYHDPEGAGRPTRWQWRFRNAAWKTVAPYFSYLMKTHVRSAKLRYLFINWFYRLIDLFMAVFVVGKNTCATDQIIRYPHAGGRSRYIFSIWAFPEERYMQILREYFVWVRAYEEEKGYRPDMTHVGYRIHQDRSNLLSYSYDGNVMTIDPVSTGNEGWDEFLVEYNQWCSERGGLPLLNQTPRLTRAQVQRAFGRRAAELERWRRRFDPRDRLLNEYFRELFCARPEVRPIDVDPARGGGLDERASAA